MMIQSSKAYELVLTSTSFDGEVELIEKLPEADREWLCQDMTQTGSGYFSHYVDNVNEALRLSNQC